MINGEDIHDTCNAEDSEATLDNANNSDPGSDESDLSDDNANNSHSGSAENNNANNPDSGSAENNIAENNSNDSDPGSAENDLEGGDEQAPPVSEDEDDLQEVITLILPQEDNGTLSMDEVQNLHSRCYRPDDSDVDILNETNQRRIYDPSHYGYNAQGFNMQLRDINMAIDQEVFPNNVSQNHQVLDRSFNRTATQNNPQEETRENPTQQEVCAISESVVQSALEESENRTQPEEEDALSQVTITDQAQNSAKEKTEENPTSSNTKANLSSDVNLGCQAQNRTQENEGNPTQSEMDADIPYEIPNNPPAQNSTNNEDTSLSQTAQNITPKICKRKVPKELNLELPSPPVKRKAIIGNCEATVPQVKVDNDALLINMQEKSREDRNQQPAGLIVPEENDSEKAVSPVSMPSNLGNFDLISQDHKDAEEANISDIESRGPDN